MATLFTNKATSNATVGGQTVDFLSNEITAELFDEASITLVKSQSSGLVVASDTLSYTVIVTNLTLSPVLNFNFLDTIPNGLTFKTGTFKVDTIAQTPTLNLQDLSYQINQLPIGVTTITFDCTVN